jgi:hypothetical protein
MMGTLIYLALLNKMLATSQITFEKVDYGTASLYRPWRKSRFVPYARYPGNWSVKPTPRDLVCAHRTLPFWTILRLRTKRGRIGYCVVLDRGPYGYCAPTKRRRYRGTNWARCKNGFRWRVAVRRKHRKRGGYYRGVIDATPAVHKTMGSPGWVKVTVERLVGAGRRKRVLRLN